MTDGNRNDPAALLCRRVDQAGSESQGEGKGPDRTGWVDWLGREQIKGGFGNVYLYVLEYVRNGIAVYSRERLPATDLELLEAAPAEPACLQK